MECIFCRIIKGEIPAVKLFENERIIAFNDINSVAPTHILILPKTHISTINDIDSSNYHIVGECVKIAAELAHEKGIAEGGYRLVYNCNSAGGQEVFHIHLHLLGGRQMKWPPG